MTISVFVSYRRDDAAAQADRLSDDVARAIGPYAVFIDVVSVAPGQPWPETIESALGEAPTIVVVIGPHWLGMADEHGRRRIDDPDDWVHREVRHAVTSRKTLIPVLVANARMPPGDRLPEALRGLASRQAVELRRDYWRHDIRLLLDRLPRISRRGTPPFPLPPSHVFGVVEGAQCHSGQRHQDRPLVRDLQLKMLGRGWYLGHEGADGIFGPRVRAAVVAFQREKRLDVDGLVGPRTWRALWEEPVT